MFSITNTKTMIQSPTLKRLFENQTIYTQKKFKTLTTVYT